MLVTVHPRTMTHVRKFAHVYSSITNQPTYEYWKMNNYTEFTSPKSGTARPALRNEPRVAPVTPPKKVLARTMSVISSLASLGFATASPTSMPCVPLHMLDIDINSFQRKMSKIDFDFSSK